MIVEYRKVKCNNCGKEEKIKDGGSKPTKWLDISITEWFRDTGTGRFNREVCSDKCVLELIKKLKEIPKKETYIY